MNKQVNIFFIREGICGFTCDLRIAQSNANENSVQLIAHMLPEAAVKSH